MGHHWRVCSWKELMKLYGPDSFGEIVCYMFKVVILFLILFKVGSSFFFLVSYPVLWSLLLQVLYFDALCL